MASAERQPSPHPPADQAAVVQAVTVIMGIGEAVANRTRCPAWQARMASGGHRAGPNSCLPTIDPRRLHGLDR
jgi:hypothetical protein